MADNYDAYTRDELLRLLRERDRKPKFGLVWERDEIEHDKAVNDDFVALDFLPGLSCPAADSSAQAPQGQSPQLYRNLIIEGDNFDALRFLRMTHAGKVKCIYIDPPYNTGNRDFIYNDRFVDKDDAYKHSKWLEFMYRRLELAKELLAEDGVIFVSIGEEEQAPLALLMDRVFPGMKMGTFIWRRRSGAQDAKERFQSVDHEYVLAYGMPGFRFGGTAKNIEDYSNPDNDPRGTWVSGDLNKAHTMKQRADAFYPIRNPLLDVWYPCDPDNVWRFASKHRLNGQKKIRTKPLEDLIDEGRVLWPRDEKPVTYHTEAALLAAIEEGSAPRNLRVYLLLDELKGQIDRKEAPEKLLDNIPPLGFWVGKSIGYGKPRYKRFWSELKHAEKPVSTWILPASSKLDELEGADFSESATLVTGYTSEGTSLLAQMLGNKDFPYPKPMSLLQNLIAQATGDGDLIVDFFAGSGTTGQAVLALNAEDGGSRRFILVSSTEATLDEADKNVCRDITQRRLRAAIEGYEFRTPKGVKAVEGLGGDFAYLRARRIAGGRVHEDLRDGQIWLALQLIHLATLQPYARGREVQTAEFDHGVIAYCAKVNADTLAEIEGLAADHAEVVVYSRQPALLRHYLSGPPFAVEPIPAFLLNRFGASHVE